ncbi:MAG TPA: non-canonical purine NTP pyrophosphatase [Gemmatimonadales bacterium]|nr:non-canonical purine NTP pyrophosphatase [Gemmatimonadales bacterium]
MKPARLLVATRSAGKQREVRALLDGTGIEVVFPDDAGLWESPEEHRLELGDTFEANARAKAEYFARRSGLPTIADDSGLEVFALGGDPGVRSKRWAGAEGTEKEVEAANNAFLLRRLLGAPEPRRRARYRCVLAYVAKPGGVPATFEGACAGRILEAPAGDGGFGYDPLFFSDDLAKSFGEATAEEKHAVSHRGRAFAAFREAIAPTPTAQEGDS